MWPLTASNQSHKIANTFSLTQIFIQRFWIQSIQQKRSILKQSIDCKQTLVDAASFPCIKMNDREKEFNPMLRTVRSGTFEGISMIHFYLQTNRVDLLISCIQMYVLIVLFHNDSINSYWVRCWWLRHGLQAYSFLLLCSNGHICLYRMVKVLLMSWAIAQFGLCFFALWFFLLAKMIAIINSLPPIYDEILKQVTFLVQRLFFSPHSVFFFITFNDCWVGHLRALKYQH